MFALEKDNKTLKDFPEKMNIEGTFVIKATKQDMIDMIDGVYDFGGDNKPSRETRRDEQPRRSRQEEPRRSRRVADDDVF